MWLPEIGTRPVESVADRVAAKLEEGDFNGAIRLPSSGDSLAEVNEYITISALKQKYPALQPGSNMPSLSSQEKAASIEVAKRKRSMPSDPSQMVQPAGRMAFVPNTLKI